MHSNILAATDMRRKSTPGKAVCVCVRVRACVRVCVCVSVSWSEDTCLSPSGARLTRSLSLTYPNSYITYKFPT